MSTASSPSASGSRARSSSSPCILCDIVRGRAPAPRVLETGRILVIVPLHPKSDGHCLVIPKRHYARLHEVPDATLAEIILTVKRLAKGMDLSSYNILQNNGQHAYDPGVRPRGPPIEHVHVHVIPRRRKDGVRITRPDSPERTRDERNRMAAGIRRRLGVSGPGAG